MSLSWLAVLVPGATRQVSLWGPTQAVPNVFIPLSLRFPMCDTGLTSAVLLHFLWEE